MNLFFQELLRRTWSDEFDNLYELGSAIYCYIFDHNPNCKQLFPFISKYQGDEWKESKEFRSQALKFVQVRFFKKNKLASLSWSNAYLKADGFIRLGLAARKVYGSNF